MRRRKGRRLLCLVHKLEFKEPERARFSLSRYEQRPHQVDKASRTYDRAIGNGLAEEQIVLLAAQSPEERVLRGHHVRLADGLPRRHVAGQLVP